MGDKSTKALLIVAIFLLGLLLLRSVPIGPAQAQASVPARTPPVMVVDNATLYVLDNNKIYVYYWDGPGVRQAMHNMGAGKLKLMQTMDANLKP